MPDVCTLKHVFQMETAKVSTNADIKLAVTQDSKEIQRSDDYKNFRNAKKMTKKIFHAIIFDMHP